jgi:hypothetical protein
VPPDFHPMKGPMVTQSLRGMENHGPMHWRGDRTGGNDEMSAQPEDGAFDEHAAFTKFNGAFVDLLGRTSELPSADMDRFADFILRVVYPPNPIRSLDNALTPSQQAGHDLFKDVTTSPFGSCASCHTTDTEANASEGFFQGFFGTDGRSAVAPETQVFKVPHLRNMYEKVGMFGTIQTFVSSPSDPFLGDQIRGFGFNHDGSVPTLFQFVGVFDQRDVNPFGIPVDAAGAQMKKDLAEYQFAFENNLAPIVGQQATLDATNALAVGARIDLLKARADVYECDLVAKGRIGFVPVGFVYAGGGQFLADRQSVPPVDDATLRALVKASNGALTFTCVPPGSGERIGVDRDLDGFLDGDEVAAGSDPADADSTPFIAQQE